MPLSKQVTPATLKCIELTFEDVSYPYYWGYDCLDILCDKIIQQSQDRILIITDDRVETLVGQTVAQRLEADCPTLMLSVGQGESSKTLDTVQSLGEKAIAWGATRRTLVLAMGGGLVGNVGGLLAALLFRGLRLIHMPTTMVAIFDGVISLKQAVNSTRSKNLFGTYYRPEAVLTDLKFLESLPIREVRSGICELIKNALAIQPQQIPFLRRHLEPEHRYSPETYSGLLRDAIAAKVAVMSHDKWERRRGLILEYGHTLGHAIEMATYHDPGVEPVSHGEAVGLGMLAAAHVAEEMGHLGAADLECHRELLSRAGAPVRLPPRLRPERILEVAHYDNKRGYRLEKRDHVPMILLQSLGQPVGDPAMPLTFVPWTLAQEAIQALYDDRDRSSLPVRCYG